MCGCGVCGRYIDVCYCDMFSVVNVYLDHLKFCVVCINSRMYVCCSECDVVSNEPISSSLFLNPFMLTCNMMRFLSLLLLGLCVCVVLVVLW